MRKPTLILCLLYVVLFTACPLTAATETSAIKWEQAIQDFEASDKKLPPPAGAALFIGSSTIRMWKNLDKDFPGIPIINRGFGGSQISDSVAYIERIVLPYKPKAIFFYAGGNDMASGKTPEAVAADYKAFVEKIRAKMPEVPIVWIEQGPSPSRWSQADKQKKLNQLVLDYTKTQPKLDYSKGWDEFLGADGKPRSEFFLPDKLHNNPEGYKVRIDLIRPYVEKYMKSGK